MPGRPNALYRNAAEEFAHRVVASLGGRVDSIVLFGSVARKRATRESDIDVLVIGEKHEPQGKVLDTAYDVWEQSDFDAFITVVYFTREELRELARLGSPFIANVLEEGIILYDTGIFAVLRKRLPASF